MRIWRGRWKRRCDPYNRSMSVYTELREELEKHEFAMGLERGRLAVTLDVLTDALVLVGQHGVYCQSARQPGRPAMDIQIITKSLGQAKELVASVMDELRRKSAVQ
jgi:hypothetical protein